MTDPTGWTYVELTEAYLGRGDLIDALYEQEEASASAIDGMDTKIERLNATIERVKALVRPLGILYAALPDGLYARRCKAILDDLRAALEGAS